MTRQLSLVAVLLATTACGQDYPLTADSQPHDNVPKGTVTKHVLAPGKFYPGVPHNYSLYVPSQYDKSKPTPFMIFLDGGNGGRTPTVFDNLIAKGDIPPMIGIFIDPGVLPTHSPNAMNRYNRIFEYDSIGPRYAEFLIGELIPEVARSYNLSKDPNDRGLSGRSTGAVGAFAAAWNRPDQFRRVISFIGTYVAMKGADQWPALIRKTEPKPIRIFLQDGKNDHIVPGHPFGTFYAGSWPINNQVMYEAFQYSGYDCKLDIGTGGHDGKQADAIMPDVLRWLWREYPKPIEVHEPATMQTKGWDPRGKVYSMVWAGKGWERVGSDYGKTRAPAADPDGNLYFADDKKIYRAQPNQNVSVFKEAAGVSDLHVGPDGRIYAVRNGSLVSWAPSGSDEKVQSNQAGRKVIALAATGKMYFDKSAAFQSIREPSAMSFSPDQELLFVADSESRYSWNFQIAPDGSLENGEPFYRLETPEDLGPNGATSVISDAIGQVYFATPLGIQMCEANGRVAAIFNSPSAEPVTGIAWGGKDLKYLYATAGGRLYRRPVKEPGANPWVPSKPPKPPL